MANPVTIENIEEMRRREGIDDLELRAAIHTLRVGDCVMLTFLPATAPCAGETLSVKITHIAGSSFRGKLACGPLSARLSPLRVGAIIAFGGDHIHSIRKRPLDPKPRLSCRAAKDPRAPR